MLVNNAGNFYAGFFENLNPSGHPGADRDQPVRPDERSPRRAPGHACPAVPGFVITITSTAGIVGRRVLGAYAASKFRWGGLVESLAPEVEPFGIRTMLVEPGYFRTELLTPEVDHLRGGAPSTTTPSAPPQIARRPAEA